MRKRVNYSFVFIAKHSRYVTFNAAVTLKLLTSTGVCLKPLKGIMEAIM